METTQPILDPHEALLNARMFLDATEQTGNQILENLHAARTLIGEDAFRDGMQLVNEDMGENITAFSELCAALGSQGMFMAMSDERSGDTHILQGLGFDSQAGRYMGGFMRGNQRVEMPIEPRQLRLQQIPSRSPLPANPATHE